MSSGATEALCAWISLSGVRGVWRAQRGRAGGGGRVVLSMVPGLEGTRWGSAAVSLLLG